jgi:hypothetical protein
VIFDLGLTDLAVVPVRADYPNQDLRVFSFSFSLRPRARAASDPVE